MYKKNAQIIKHLDFIVIDLLAVAIAIFLAFALRDGILPTLRLTRFHILVQMMMLCDIVTILLLKTMEGVLKRDAYDELKVTMMNTLVLVSLFCFFLLELKSNFTYSREFSAIGIALYLVISYVFRCAWKYYRIQYKKVIAPRSIMLITVKDEAEELVNSFLENNYEHYHVNSIVLLDEEPNDLDETLFDIPVIKGKKAAISHASREWVDEIIFLTNNMQEEDADLMEKFRIMGITVHLRLFYSKKAMPDQCVEQISGMTVLTSSTRYVSVTQLVFKRLLDILGGLVGSLITVLILLIIGPIIKKESPGPILFKQTRVGRGGKKFVMYKLRSMYPDAEARKAELMKAQNNRDPRMFKMEFDPRIIGSQILPDGTVKKGIGNYIRDYSLDEFPQFFNVLLGDMSLVGTRPPTVDEWEQYDLHHRSRLAIKPGITGLWQTSGRSNITDFDEVVKLDNDYILQWNFATDIKLILKTVVGVLKKDGAM